MGKNHKNCNGEEHKKWSRRSFLQALGFVGAGSMALGSSGLTYAANNKLSAGLNTADSENILIIIRLFGGNDGLNTIVPLNQYDLYANLRPRIKHAESYLWNLSDDYAMPEHMRAGMESMWNEGKMKVVHSVGYENQSQSHFKGTDIWSSAKDDNSTETGWMGRYFEDQYPDYVDSPPVSPTAVQIGTRSDTTFNGTDSRYSFSVSSISFLDAVLNTGVMYETDGLSTCSRGQKIDLLRAMYNSTFNHAGVIYDAYQASEDYTEGDGYNTDTSDDFAAALSKIARLIKGNLGTKVYTLDVGGFDTHIAQTADHQELTTFLSNALKYFHEDMAAAGFGDKVLTMVVSEFGRRVFENGSLGTDHGIAAPVMFFGEGLNGSGFVGEHGSLEADQLYNGRDLQWHTDFKQVYATVLKEWMCVDPSIVDSTVLDSEYDSLDLGFSCSGTLTSTSGSSNVQGFTSNVIYDAGNTNLVIQNNIPQHVVIELYDLNGRRIGQIANTFLTTGSHSFDIKKTLNKDLDRGYYMYNITTNSKNKSGKLMVI